MMAGHLVALDKSPGVRPIGVGEVWRRLIVKSVLQVTGEEATDACGRDQLCAGLPAGVEGGIRAAQEMRESHSQEEEWGFLLVDASNAFNEVNRRHMLWVVRHEWPAGSQFVFNCYRHWAQLVVRAGPNGGKSQL